MNKVPPDRDLPDEVDDAYRRASHQDLSRPSESARRAVLEHAAQLAAERSAKMEPTLKKPNIDFKEPAANQSHWRPAIFGTLAAAAIAGLLLTPHYFSSQGPGLASLPPAPAAVSSSASAPAPGERSADKSDFSRDAMRAERRTAVPPMQAQDMGKPPLAARNTAPAAPAADSAVNDATGERVGADGAEEPTTSAQAEAPQAVAQAARNARAASDRAAAAPPAIPTDPALQLRRAAENGEIVELQSLLDQQIAIEERDANGRTPLMLATLHGRTVAVRVLLAHGADPNAADARGMTPLQAALAGHQSDIAVALRLAGAR